ncbi:hypothetical protein T484DRAFT_1954970 [Baffinella frigidus]|nr:hypothetical protein T484DRAFT_1954970 [Cryptophyta sp. CCMP2293]
MVVLGGEAVSYERGTPVPLYRARGQSRPVGTGHDVRDRQRGPNRPPAGPRQVLGPHGRVYEPTRHPRDSPDTGVPLS